MGTLRAGRLSGGWTQGPVVRDLCSPGQSPVLTASIQVIWLASNLGRNSKKFNLQVERLSLVILWVVWSSAAAAFSKAPFVSPGAVHFTAVPFTVPSTPSTC